MLIVIDKITKKEVKTHDMNRVCNNNYPDGNIPGVVFAENEKAVFIMDGSQLMQKIMSAYDFDFIFDIDGNAVDIVVIKTMEEYLKEPPPVIQSPTPSLQEQITQLQQQLLITQNALDFILLNSMP